MNPRWSLTRRTVRPEERLLPLLQRYPEVWAVLRRHGVGYRGGPEPSESVATFATSRQLDPALFRDECSAIVRTRASSRGTIEAICRAYLIGGAALSVLTGAIWSVGLLSRVSVEQAPGLTGLRTFQAQAESQVYGWVGLLCMGLSYAILPRVWRGRLAVPWLSGLILGLMLSAIAARAVVLLPAPDGSLATFGNVAAWLQLVAVALFSAQFAWTFRRSRTRVEPITGFLLVGLGWLLASSVLFVMVASLGRVAEWPSPLWFSTPLREPLRAMQNHGLALAVSLGLSLSLLPRYFNLPAVGERRAWWSLDLIATAVLAEILLSMALGASGNETFVVGLVVSRLMLASGVVLLSQAWCPWRPIAGAGVCGWFVRGALAWLAVSMVLLVVQPIFDLVTGRGLGVSAEASRHALTSGYLTLLLMGVATRALASRREIDPVSVPGLACLFGVFCMAAGLRLASLAVGEAAGVFPVLVGSSVLLRVLGLVGWGVVLWRLGSGQERQREAELHGA